MLSNIIFPHEIGLQKTFNKVFVMNNSAAKLAGLRVGVAREQSSLEDILR